MINGIVCVTYKENSPENIYNWAIGKNNALLFKLSEDLRNFKRLTEGNIVVMGKNTLNSLPGGKALKNRVNIVLSTTERNFENCICYSSFDKLIYDLKILSTVKDIYIIGGGKLYETMLPYYDRIIVTKVDAIDKEATTYFPNLDTNTNFIITDISNTLVDNGYTTKRVTYERIK